MMSHSRDPACPDTWESTAGTLRAEIKYTVPRQTMDPGSVLQHQMPIHGDYSLPSEHDCIDQYSGHAHHPAYSDEGAVDQMRRDGALPQPTPSPFMFTPANNARFLGDVALASDTTGYGTGQHHTDSSTGSISTSPSSAASTLPYTNYSTTAHYTTLPTFCNAVLQPQAFVQDLHSGSRVAPLFDSTTAGIQPLFNPLRSTISSPTDAGNREFYARSARYVARPSLPTNNYASHSETPRSVFAAPSLLHPPQPPAYTPHMASSSTAGYGTSQNECASFQFPELFCQGDMICVGEGQPVTPDIIARVEKGFFVSPSDGKWTCYRRNYFSVVVHFEINPFIHGSRLYLVQKGVKKLIQAMGVRLSATADGVGGKEIELVAHTPKRDAGPKTKIKTVMVFPSDPALRNGSTISAQVAFGFPANQYHATGGPHLPLQNVGEPNPESPEADQSPQPAAGYSYHPGVANTAAPGQSTSHTFERVQFKQATANNGKRRASQQYFHLVVELFVDIREDANCEHEWVKVAYRVSDRVVVRGRSPSHYNDDRNSTQRGGSTSGNPSYSTIGGGPSYGSMNPGTYGGATGTYGRDNSGNTTYHQGHYGHQHSPGYSPGSAESADGGTLDSGNTMNTVMSEADREDRLRFQNGVGYQYHPGPIYENAPAQLPLPKVEGGIRFSTTEPRQYAVKAEYPDAVPGARWQNNPCRRLQGFETSRGYYPTISSEHSGYT